MSTQAKLVLVTRPQLEGQATVHDLEKMGYAAGLEPMLEIRALDFEVPDPGFYQGLVFTSVHAVRLFAQKYSDRSVPVYVVGQTTKDAAKAVGFKEIHTANSTAAFLLELIKREVTDKNRPLLYVRGKYVSFPLHEELEAAGYLVGRVIAYEAVALTHLSEEAQRAFREGRVAAVTFFSKRTAEAFITAVKAANLEGFLTNTKALCISESVLNYVRSYAWQDAYAASQPDASGLYRLVSQHVPPDERNEKLGSTQMSSSSNKPIENASEVIERFGGIRPMAKKIDVAVTTIQGWKKRDVIPATRREAILNAAAEYDVDLSDIVPEAPAVANENNRSGAPAELSAVPAAPQTPVAETPEKPVQPSMPSASKAADEEERMLSPEELEEKLAAVEKRVVGSTTLIVAVLIVAVIAAAGLLLWPKDRARHGEADRLSALEARTQEIEGEVEGVKDQQSFFGTLIPENLDEQLSSLQEQAVQAREKAGEAIEKAREVSNDVLGENAGTLEQRMVKLEGHLEEMTGSPVLAGLLERVQGMSADAEGQSQLDNAMGELSKIMNGMNTELAGAENSAFEATLDAARGENEALQQTFANVPASDLKAAALLLTMTQFRSSLNRDNDAFGSDLQVLMGLVGDDDPELKASLEKLAPRAEQGVLTPAGLTNEFKSIAGDAVVASLKGEDVSLGEKAQARLNEVFEVEKDGELVSGTETQAKVAKAEGLLEQGNVEEAINTVQTLDPAALEQMGGWLKQANATLMAQKIKGLLTNSINMQAYGSPAAAAAEAAGALTGSGTRLIQDDETGINILQHNTLPNMPKDANPYH